MRVTSRATIRILEIVNPAGAPRDQAVTCFRHTKPVHDRPPAGSKTQQNWGFLGKPTQSFPGHYIFAHACAA